MNESQLGGQAAAGARSLSAPRPRHVSVAWCVLLLGLSVGCSDATDSSSDVEPPAPASTSLAPHPFDPVAPGATIFCGMVDDGGKPTPEIHMLYAMNKKLAAYPEFAQASGLQTVSDCEGARRFQQEYATYRMAHGRFDADEPLGELPPDSPETFDPNPPDEGSPTPEIQKLYPVMDVPNNAVVQLNFQAPGNVHSSWKINSEGWGRCTGILLNKNWILTAAHCLTLAAINPCLKAGLSIDECKAQPSLVWWDNYLAFTISGTIGTNHDFWPLPNKKVRVYVHQNWLGRDLDQNPKFCPPNGTCYDVQPGAEHDLGLIYVSQLYDAALQPEIEAQGALRYSTVSPSTNWSYAFYGHGLPGDLAPPLRKGLLTKETVESTRFEVFQNYLKVTLAEKDSTLCQGDSGGPLVRTGLSFETNTSSPAIETGLEAVVGVASAATIGCDPSQPVTGRVNYWTRVDSPKNVDFIHRTLSHWYPYQLLGTTTRLPAEGGVVEEAWGKPCHDVAAGCDDDPSKICFHAAPFFGSQNCAACGGNGCGCIVGQCVPRRSP